VYPIALSILTTVGHIVDACGAEPVGVAMKQEISRAIEGAPALYPIGYSVGRMSLIRYFTLSPFYEIFLTAGAFGEGKHHFYRAAAVLSGAK
jgi:hypothetical protein